MTNLQQKLNDLYISKFGLFAFKFHEMRGELNPLLIFDPTYFPSPNLALEKDTMHLKSFENCKSN
jgi:hypothetical protein